MNDVIFLWLTTILVILSTIQYQVSGFECKRSEKRCPGGSCVESWLECPKCADRYEVPCPDGTCVRLGNSCLFKGCSIEEKKCPDGRCVPFARKCSDGCSYNEKKCDTGTCISIERYCPEQSCPINKTRRCADGDCYPDVERCNDKPYCLDSSDEKDCSFNFQQILNTPWLVVIISVIIFALFCLIIALCCRYRHNEERRRQQRRAARHRQQYPQNYDEMPVVAGRRTQPVPSRQQSTPSQVSQDPRSPNFGSAPSPYNPELIPFITSSPYGPQAPSPYQQPGGNTPRAATEPSAPPLGLEPHLAPPPYHEAMGDDFVPAQPGVPGRDYLPSYETVQRSGPPGPTGSSDPVPNLRA